MLSNKQTEDKRLKRKRLNEEKTIIENEIYKENIRHRENLTKLTDKIKRIKEELKELNKRTH